MKEVAPPAETSLLSATNFATRFARGDRSHRAVMALHRALLRLEPNLPTAALIEWLEDVVHWLRSRGPLPEQRAGETVRDARARMLLEAMEFLPTETAWLRAAVARLFSSSRAVALFTDVGVPSRQGFIAELADRLSRAVLPDPPVERELGDLLVRLFQTEAAVSWFERLDAGLRDQLFVLLAVSAGAELEPLRRDMAEAAVLLALRIGHQGLANDVRARSVDRPLVESPYFRLTEVIRRAVRGGETSEGAEAWREAIAAARKLTSDVEQSLETTGVSVDLVYRLVLIRRQLDRLYALMTLIGPSGGTAIPAAGMHLFLTLVRGAYRDRSMLDVFRTSTRLLARRVVDAAAHSGEHYVTRTKAEYHALLGAAAGGGFVTAFTALLKFVLGGLGLAPFWQGLAFSVNYAGSFIAMQLAGFSLASKQPAMTAAHLSRVLGSGHEVANDLDALTLEVARTVRSQVAATAGNLGGVIPVAVAVDLGARLLLGHGVLDAAHADAVIAQHQPLTSAVLPGAAFTGVALWLSSLAAGTMENWATYRRLPEAVSSHRALRAMFGPVRAANLSRWLFARLPGFGGNVALGLQMGLLPTFGQFFGLPLQLPHIAVSTGQLAFAGASRGAHGVLHADFLLALVALIGVGILNFGVSFSLALWVAVRARDTEPLAIVRVARAVAKHLLAHPADFLRPPAPDAK